MRAIDEALQARLDSGATTLCDCWRILRADGAAFGFTDHDEAVTFDGLVHAPGGFRASAQETATGLSVDNLRVHGALSSEAISEAEIAAGRYDGAIVERWLVDWRAPELRALLFKGRIGEVARAGAAFSAEVEGLGAALNAPIGRVYQPLCDADFGDARCGVDVAARGLLGAGVVSAVGSDGGFFVSGLEGRPARFFERGLLLWTSGANARSRGLVAAHEVEETGARLALRSGFGAPVAVGDAFTVAAGCDKRMETCRDRFANLLNFRGFPHLPGEDWLLAGAGGSAGDDGGSMNG
ncbi:MAG: DUF2163 domain-containing protein [Rubrimonas sp.]|uniref:DUF2163 domain-containing protein n=1 Tax=Rubrimonas sp. TaxID=2036015 RepID=UPI002FDDF85E